VYYQAGKDECSDDLTNSTFDYLGEELPSIWQSSIANICLEGLLLALALFTLYYQKSDEGEELAAGKKGEGSPPAAAASEGSYEMVGVAAAEDGALGSPLDEEGTGGGSAGGYASIPSRAPPMPGMAPPMPAPASASAPPIPPAAAPVAAP